jgi:hypothetical protein
MRMCVGAFCLVAAGCAAPAQELELDFRVSTEVDSHEKQTWGLRDVVTDADVETTLMADPADLTRLTVRVTNKTGSPIDVLWDQSSLGYNSCFSGRIPGPRVSSDLPCTTLAPGASGLARFILPSPLGLQSTAPAPLEVPMVIGGKRIVKIYELMLYQRVAPPDRFRERSARR